MLFAANKQQQLEPVEAAPKRKRRAQKRRTRNEETPHAS
jgi:hypothetical protein